jgi:2-keto-4-pentenoate hydratase
MKKMIFNSVMIISVSACVQINPDIQPVEEPYVEKDGKLIVEVEKPNLLNSEHAELSVGSNEHEDIYIQQQSSNEDLTNDENGLIYFLSINQPGKYRIWARVNGNAAKEAYEIRIDENEMNKHGNGQVHHKFTWINQNATYTFNTGRYTMSVKMKEPGIMVDKFMLIRDDRQTPDGNVATSDIMNESDEIVDKLLSARQKQKHLAPFNVTYGDYSLGDAYIILQKLSDRLNQNLGNIVGYKMAFATESALEKFNLNEPVYGPFFEQQEIKNKGTVNLDEFMQFHIENEITFVLSQDVTEKVQSIDELKGYIKSIHLGFDMADGRFNRANSREGINDFVASGGGAHRFLIGDAIDGIDHDLVDKMLRIQHDGTLIYEGNSNNAFNNPWNALLWIVNELIEHGQDVKKEMLFMTGKVDSPYTPDKENAPGKYTGTCGEFPPIQCTVK